MRGTLQAAATGVAAALALGGTALAADVRGDWVGTLDVSPAMSLHLGLHILKGPEGAYTGTFDSPDQNSFDVPVADIVSDGDAFAFAVPSAKGSYAGRWDAGVKAWVGQWTQGGRNRLLRLTAGRVAGRPVVEGLDGDWDGALAFPSGINLRLAFHIHTGPHGTLGTLDSIDQQAMGVGLSAVGHDGAQVRFEIKRIQGTFEGALDPAGGAIVGRWSQLGRDTPLTLTRRAPGQAQAVLRRPQTPVKPYPYDEEEVVFDDVPAHVRLAGTLTRPRGKGPFPAVVLVAGSGPNARDEAVFGHHIFRVLADHLTRNGLAVLRYDKRGIEGSTGDYGAATTADFADDAQAAAAYLRARKDIDPRRVGLIGHSEGGLIVPMVAARDPSTAFIVMMAGPGVNGADVWLEQLRLILKASGASDDRIATLIAQRRGQIAILRSENRAIAFERGERGGRRRPSRRA